MSKSLLKAYELLWEKRYHVCSDEKSTVEDFKQWANSRRHYDRALYLSGNLVSAKQFEQRHGIK